jgi:hypothetical protein
MEHKETGASNVSKKKIIYLIKVLILMIKIKKNKSLYIKHN